MDVGDDQPAQPTIACTLDAGDLDDRILAWRRLGQQALIARERTRTQVTLTYRADPDVAQRLDALVALERACCPSLDLRTRRSGDTLVLEIEGPPEAEPILGMFASDPSG